MDNNWLKLQQVSDTAKVNILCLPFAGGYAEYFLNWRQYMPAHFRLCPIELPGRSYLWQQACYTDIQQLLAAMLPQLEKFVEESHYIIFGHSMGGYIGYELCKLFIKLNLPLPKLLVVSSLLAPKNWQSRKLYSQVSEKEFVKFFLNLGGFHPEFLKHKKFMELQMKLLRSDLMLCDSCTYVGPANFPFPILAMGGSSDEYIKFQSMAEWQQETKDAFFSKKFSGDHFYLNHHLQEIFELITKQVNDCD